jgi:hypothetical protein
LKSGFFEPFAFRERASEPNLRRSVVALSRNAGVKQNSGSHSDLSITRLLQLKKKNSETGPSASKAVKIQISGNA